MQLTEILDLRAVRHSARTTSKKRLFCEVADLASDVYGLAAPDVFSALQERESLGPTGVGDGIALPHARLPGLTSVRGLFHSLETPLDFGSVDRRPVDLVFTLLAPEGAGVAHLKALALVSRTMRNPALCEKLRANHDPQVLHTILTEARTSEAA